MTKWVNLYSVFFSLKVSFFFYMSNEECIPFSQYIWKAFILHFQMNVEAVYKYWLSCTKKFNIRFEEKYFCKKIDFGSMILLPKLSSIIRYLLHATFYVASYLYYLQSRDNIRYMSYSNKNTNYNHIYFELLQFIQRLKGDTLNDLRKRQ